MSSYVTGAIAAENTFTDWITPKIVRADLGIPGHVDLSCSGTFEATVTVQKRYFTGNNPSDLTYTDPIDAYSFTNASELDEMNGTLFSYSSRVQFRVGVKTGGYTSGTANLRLDQ
jgi:hypothetical protein